MDEISVKSDVHECHVQIHVRRDFTVFLTKNLLVLMLIVEAALLSLWLNPLIPPLVGARFGIHLTAMLTVAVRSSQSLESTIGDVTQLLWIDGFDLLQFATVLTSLVTSTVIHVLVRRQREALAVSIDRVCRRLLPLVVYPMACVGMIVMAYIPSEAAGYTIILSALLLPLVGGTMWVAVTSTRFEMKRRRLVVELASGAEVTNDGAPLLNEVFQLFDLDNSGTINEKEMRLLLTKTYPSLPIERRREMLKSLSTGADVALEEFCEIVCSWRNYVAEHELAHHSRSARASRQSSTKGLVKGMSTTRVRDQHPDSD